MSFFLVQTPIFLLNEKVYNFLHTNEIPVRSDIHRVPGKGVLRRPVGETFMMLACQNQVSEMRQKQIFKGEFFKIYNKNKRMFVNLQHQEEKFGTSCNGKSSLHLLVNIF